MDESQEAIDHYAAEDARIAANDFRGHTCGECAWAYVWAGENFTCRRTGWMNSETGDGHSVSMSACPAFVPSKVENHNVKL